MEELLCQAGGLNNVTRANRNRLWGRFSRCVCGRISEQEVLLGEGDRLVTPVGKGLVTEIVWAEPKGVTI